MAHNFGCFHSFPHITRSIRFPSPMVRQNSQHSGIRCSIHIQLNRHADRTYAFAFLLSALAVYTPAFVYGPPTFGSNTDSLVQRLKWISLFAEFKYVLTTTHGLGSVLIKTRSSGYIPLWNAPSCTQPLVRSSVHGLEQFPLRSTGIARGR
jgi:hypothetical protein